MADVAAGARIPDVLKGAWSKWKELGALLDHCGDVIRQVALYCQTYTQDANDMTGGLSAIESAVESLRDVVITVSEKGFLWSLVNASTLDDRIGECEQSLERAYVGVNEMGQKYRQQQLNRARTIDQQDFSIILASSTDGHDLLRKIQRRETTPRREEEIVVALRKHNQGVRGSNPRAEDEFIHKSSEILSQLYNVNGNAAIESFTISSLEVEIDTGALLGSGAFSQVFKGLWAGTRVAVKQIRSAPGWALSASERQKFRHEVKIWSQLRHPNILPLYGACLEAEFPFLLTLYCGFGTVRQYLNVHTNADRMKFSREVTGALAYLHAQGIVHADVKTENILIYEDGRALLSDFGLALKLQQYCSTLSYSENMDVRRGTFRYMAPEVLQGASPGREADVYSLALTIWEIFSDGECPYERYIDHTLLVNGVAFNHYREARPRRMTEDRVWVVVQRSWAPDPATRPTAKAVQDALEVSISEIVHPTDRPVHSDQTPSEVDACPITASNGLDQTVSNSATAFVATRDDLETGTKGIAEEWSQQTITPRSLYNLAPALMDASISFSGSNDISLLTDVMSEEEQVLAADAVNGTPHSLDLPPVSPCQDAPYTEGVQIVEMGSLGVMKQFELLAHPEERTQWTSLPQSLTAETGSSRSTKQPGLSMQPPERIQPANSSQSLTAETGSFGSTKQPELPAQLPERTQRTNSPQSLTAETHSFEFTKQPSLSAEPEERMQQTSLPESLAASTRSSVSTKEPELSAQLPKRTQHATPSQSLTAEPGSSKSAKQPGLSVQPEERTQQISSPEWLTVTRGKFQYTEQPKLSARRAQRTQRANLPHPLAAETGSFEFTEQPSLSAEPEERTQQTSLPQSLATSTRSSGSAKQPELSTLLPERTQRTNSSESLTAETGSLKSAKQPGLSVQPEERTQQTSSSERPTVTTGKFRYTERPKLSTRRARRTQRANLPQSLAAEMDSSESTKQPTLSAQPE
ncbi:hypothetical protein NM688_g3072 [Phlebia brevispora]|uniref:Uncharacterized protein n=1 Tax=Phlebia brevispora TaxID=194682 RepID=A0ACC1T6I7_9APHY|nr:hypothetical protein NM688_g3072 [Phlebia brevispora]